MTLGSDTNKPAPPALPCIVSLMVLVGVTGAGSGEEELETELQ